MRKTPLSGAGRHGSAVVKQAIHTVSQKERDAVFLAEEKFLEIEKSDAALFCRFPELVSKNMEERFLGSVSGISVPPEEIDIPGIWTVIGKPKEIWPGCRIWKLTVHDPAGSLETVLFRHSESGFVNLPQESISMGSLVMREHVEIDGATGARKVVGSVMWFRPFWKWSTIPVTVPAEKIISEPWEADGDLRVESVVTRISPNLKKLAPLHLERCIVAGFAGSLKEVMAIPLAYVLNFSSELNFAVYISSAELRETKAPEYSFSADQVSNFEERFMARSNAECVRRMLVGRPSIR